MPKARKTSYMEFANPSRAATQARINKQRGNMMERAVSKYLNRGRTLQTRRTPMSGAGWIKGDNHVPLSYPPDFFLISCKTSEAIDHNDRPYIPFHKMWFNELARDVSAMRSIGCTFGILVVKYHGRRQGELFAFLRMEDAEQIKKHLDLDITAPCQHNHTIGFRKNGQPNGSWRVYRDELLKCPIQRWITPGGELVSMHLETIYEALLVQDVLAANEISK